MRYFYTLVRYRMFIFFLAVMLAACTAPDKTDKSLVTLDETLSAQSVVVSENRLWYQTPAIDWETEALPVGNGYMGAMVFGGVEQERIQFNEESLWAGGPGKRVDYRGGNRQGAHKSLPAVRKLLAKGQYEEAHLLANERLSGDILSEEQDSSGDKSYADFGAYQAFGDVYVDQPLGEEVSAYQRSLNLETGVLSVSYEKGAVTHKRQYFANYPSRVLVFRFENDAEEGSNYDIRLDSLHGVSTRWQDGRLIMQGHVADNGMEMQAGLSVLLEGGELTYKGNRVRVTGASTVTLILSASTDYLPQPPLYKGHDYRGFNQKVLALAEDKGYEALLAEHRKDYQSLYQRVRLHLDRGGSKMVKKKDKARADMPTDKRVQAYARDQGDTGLETLFFNYGRYLLISSSRPGSLPANLQGKWNDSLRPAWASDYHFNINIQMIYWPAEITNLAEVHQPLLDYVERLVVPGRVTASEFFNARGWVVNTRNNIFGYTAPGWQFPWGYFPSGAAWLSQHMWEHYSFGGDKTYLRETALPVMEEAALFWLDYLVINPSGQLASMPSYSPEHGEISVGASMDQQIVWDLFTNYLAACKVLDMTSDLCVRIGEAREKLLPPQIGRWGQLQEWAEDRDDPNSRHRHVSHLFALYPGQQISASKTPQLFEAAEVSLNARGDGGTGWSKAWKINLWARLKDGNRAHRLLGAAMQSAISGKALTGSEDYTSGIYPNLLSAHPPFQLDGNMGAITGIAEMLLQSHTGTIDLLPALPDAWSTGRVSGLRARGGFEVDIAWSEGKLNQVQIKKVGKALQPGKVQLHYGEQFVEFDDQLDKVWRFNGVLLPKD